MSSHADLNMQPALATPATGVIITGGASGLGRASAHALPPGSFEKRILLGRMGAPEEIGRVVRFLLSNEASYITAAEIVVDGGNVSSQRG